MLGQLFDWWILNGNEDMKPLKPRKRRYKRYVKVFPAWAEQ